MNFGTIDRYILFGGQELLCLAATKLKNAAKELFVVTSKRHASEPISWNGTSIKLQDWLSDNTIQHMISEDISSNQSLFDMISESTLGISFCAPWIFKRDLIGRFNGRLLNCHGANLPQNRGGGGFSWRILRGDKIGASVIHQVDAGVDTGVIVLSREYTYPYECRRPSDYQAFSVCQYDILLESLFRKIDINDNFEVTVQDERFSSYWPRLSTDVHGFIDWDWGLDDIETFIRAFDSHYGGASTFLNKQRVRLKKCSALTSEGAFHPFQSGIMYRKTDLGAFIATRGGALLAAEVLNENGTDILASLVVGDRFYTPAKHLERAKRLRAIYLPGGIKK